MRDVLPDILRWSQRRPDRRGHGRRRAALGAPSPGCEMAVSSTGEISGGVSGGCVEGAVVEIAEQVLAGAGPQLVHAA